MTRLGLRYSALSDLGPVRKDNQDSGYAGPNLLVVADGVGGSARGDVASSTAIDSIRSLDKPPGNDPLSQLHEAATAIHERIHDLVEAHPALEGTSTTLTALLFDGSRMAIAHAGDSRAYLLRQGEISQLTHDHTFVQGLVDEGRITAAEARVHPHRNLILKAVDGSRDPDPDLFFIDAHVGDRYLVCSDGACGVLEDEVLTRILSSGTVDSAAVELISASLMAHTTDNVTVVLADVVDLDEGDPAETMAMSLGPLLVGAAADAPRLDPISDTAVGAVPVVSDGGDEPVDPDVDPEEVRYAPQAPQRYRWLRWVISVGLAGVLLWIGGTAAYTWTQKQYFVSDSGDFVAIYRGVQARVPLITLQSVAETSQVRVADLPLYRQEQVKNGMDASSLSDARKTVARLQLAVECEAAMPTPDQTPASPSPSATPTDPCAEAQ